MTEEEFIKEAENFVYKEVAKTSNILFGKNKTAALSTGIFLKLPIEVTLEKMPEPIEPKLTKSLKDFLGSWFSAYVVKDEMYKVNFTFMYHSEKDLTALVRDFRFRSVFFAFVYMHELQHILRKHNTSSYDIMMQRIAKDMASPHALINIAEDHAINYSLADLFAISPLAGKWPEIQEVGMYSHEYHKAKMNDIEILKDLIAKGQHPTISQINNMFEKVCQGGKCTIQPIPGKGTTNSSSGDTSSDKGSKDKCDTSGDDADISLSDLSESLQDIIKTSTKGTKAGELINDLFSSIKVETGWFKKIKASFKRQVFYKTHDYMTSWANMNNTYRRIYKSPKKTFIDNKVSIILSVDHSGSVATEELQKLLYLMESEATRIGSITVLIHDTRVVKTFELADDYDITKSADFKEALSTRHVVGGTSHDDVFKTIQAMKITEPDKLIYMSFSDNYSDIEETVGKYPIMRKLTKYWINAGGVPVKTAGTNIAMV